MYYSFLIITYAFDLFIILFFMNGILGHRRSGIPAPVFYICFVLMEIVIYINQELTANLSSELSTVITSFVSVITSFLLCLLYDSRMRNRIFVAISFQVLAMIAENTFTMIVQAVNPEMFHIELMYLILFMNLGSKVLLFIFTLIVILFWNRHFKQYSNLQYNVMIITTPLLSLIIMINIPFHDILDSHDPSFFVLLYIVLAILNVVNYILFNNILKMSDLRYKYQKMEQQIGFQRDKYLQLSAAYKSNRSVLHDTKKHYFTISEYIKQQEYDKLQDYLHTSMEKLEQSYAIINTGNLVIDSFISNFIIVAKSNAIEFHPIISINAERIPINDYDLCVIIGNLLDNAMNAVQNVRNSERIIQINLSVTDTNAFIIYMKNTYNPETIIKNKADDSIDHGYGMENIQKIVEEHHGLLRTVAEDWYEVTIVIPI